MKPTHQQTKDAVRTLLAATGDNPDREGLSKTPARVAAAFSEWFAGYDQDPTKILATTFGESGGYDEIVLLQGIDVESHCEHHMAPIIGTAAVAYIPRGYVVGISKLARVVDCFAKRLQIQERLTRQIADAIQATLEPIGVAVIITARHHCMTTRGAHHTKTSMTTSAMLGAFRENAAARAELTALLR